MEKTRLGDVLKYCGINDYQYYASLPSTNDEALAWADNAAIDFSMVVADEQTSGKGRFERRWVTIPGASLAFSLILKPTPTEITQLALFAPLCGLAVHDALQDLYSLQSEIKWPNDILLNRKKCCGILVEAAWSGSQVNGIVLGIGINITPASLPTEEESLFAAVCLEDMLGKEIDRYLLLGEIIRQIKRWRPQLGMADFYEKWQSHLAFRNEQVKIVQSEKQSIIGIEKGIDEQGHLILILDNQQEMIFEVGDVHLRPTAETAYSGGNNA